MSTARPKGQDSAATTLHARAQRGLSFIRDTMERAGSFTAVPGWGGIGMGAIGLVATAVARRHGG